VWDGYILQFLLLATVYFKSWGYVIGAALGIPVALYVNRLVEKT
jgi:hypothetical protein